MTWAKFGTEYPHELARDDVPDAAWRTHTEVIMWAYQVEQTDLRVPRHQLRRICGSPDWEDAVKFLIAAGYWAEDGPDIVIRRHGDMILSSLAAQGAKRDRDRRAQRAHRSRRVSGDVSADVSADVSDEVSTYQTDRQTNTHQGGGNNYVGDAPVCANCQRPVSALASAQTVRRFGRPLCSACSADPW